MGKGPPEIVIIGMRTFQIPLHDYYFTEVLLFAKPVMFEGRWSRIKIGADVEKTIGGLAPVSTARSWSV